MPSQIKYVLQAMLQPRGALQEADEGAQVVDGDQHDRSEPARARKKPGTTPRGRRQANAHARAATGSRRAIFQKRVLKKAPFESSFYARCTLVRTGKAGGVH